MADKIKHLKVSRNKKDQRIISWEELQNKLQKDLYKELTSYVHGFAQSVEGIFASDVDRFYSNKFGKSRGKLPMKSYKSNK